MPIPMPRPLLRALTALAPPGRCGLRRALSSGLDLPTGLFGCLTVSAPDRQVEVASLDPAEHADIGRVLVPEAAAAAGVGVRARQTGERDWLVECAAEAAGTRENRRPLRVLGPVPMDLRVISGPGCSLSVVENRFIDLTTSPDWAGNGAEAAQIRFDRVKSGDAQVRSEAGAACLTLSRTLLQSLRARARDGLTLTASMYQGSELSLESSAGQVAMETGAIYCRRCSLRGARASLRCGSAHGEFAVEAADTGSVRLDSLEGSLQLRMLYGDVSLHLTRPRQVSVDLGEGSVSLGLQRPEGPDTSTLLVDITASGVDLGEGLEHLAESLFPVGARSVRFLAEVPAATAAAADPPDGERPSCAVRVHSGRVRLSLRAGSGLFAGLSRDAGTSV